MTCRTKLRRPKLTKIRLGVEIFFRKIILAAELLSDKVSSSSKWPPPEALFHVIACLRVSTSMSPLSLVFRNINMKSIMHSAKIKIEKWKVLFFLLICFSHLSVKYSLCHLWWPRDRIVIYLSKSVEKSISSPPKILLKTTKINGILRFSWF